MTISTRSRYNKILEHTCDSGDNNMNFETAAVIRINALVQQGKSHIELNDLYVDLCAVTKAQKTGVRYGVNTAKKAGVIIKTETDAIYEVR